MGQGSYEGCVHPSAGGCCWNVQLVCWRHQDLVDDVYDPVGGQDICLGHCRLADLDRPVRDCECRVLVVQHRDGHAVGHGGGLYRARVDVVGEDVSEGRVLLVRVVGRQVDSELCECRVGGCEDREWSGTLQRSHQVGMGQGSD